MSEITRNEDELDGCDLDFTTEIVRDDDPAIAELLVPPDKQYNKRAWSEAEQADMDAVDGT